eukprot:evm.model.scf_1135.2 EVM.evm.TU.scf_1135.2   scf_1135:12717-25079(+)
MAVRGRDLIALLALLQLAAGAVAQQEGPPIPQLNNKEDFVLWLQSLGEDGRLEAFRAAGPGDIPTGPYEGAMLSTHPEVSDSRVSHGNSGAMRFIFEVYPSWTGKTFYGNQSVINVRSESDLSPADRIGNLSIATGYTDEKQSWIVTYPDGSPFDIIVEELRSVRPGFIMGRGYLVPAESGDSVFFECALAATEAVVRALDDPNNQVETLQAKLVDFAAQQEQDTSTGSSPPQSPSNDGQPKKKPGRAHQKRHVATPDFRGVADYKAWLSTLTKGERAHKFKTAEPGPMPEGLYFGFVVDGYKSFQDTGISVGHQVTMHFFLDRWIGKYFGGDGSFEDVIHDGTGFVPDHLKGSIDLRMGTLDGKESWHTAFANGTAFDLFVDEFREIQPGFLYGQTFVREQKHTAQPFFEFGLVRIDPSLVEGSDFVDVLLKTSTEAAESKVATVQIPQSNIPDSEPKVQGGEPGASEPVKQDDGSAGGLDISMPSLDEEGGGQAVPEFSDTAEFEKFLLKLSPAKKDKLFSSLAPGQQPKGVHTAFILLGGPDMSAFNMSFQDQALAGVLTSQWIGKVFNEADGVRNVLRNEDTFKAEDLSGTVSLVPGLVDANDSWVVRYPSESMSSFVVDELREVRPGFLFGRTFLSEASAGDRPLFEYALSNLADGVPEGQTASNFVKSAIGDTSGDKFQAEPEPVSESESKSESEPAVESEAQAEAEPKGESEGKGDGEPYVESEGKAEAEPKAESEGKAEAEPEVEAEPKAEAEPKPEGSGLKVPKVFKDASSFQIWLASMDEDGRHTAFESATAGSAPKGVYTAFILLGGPDVSAFNMSFQDQALAGVLTSQWIGKVFNEADGVRNVLRNEDTFKPEDLSGTVSLAPGLVDANDSWVVRYPSESMSSFVVDELREVRPGFLFGRTFLSEASAGDRPLFEYVLSKLADGVPEGQTASNFVKSAIGDTSGDKFQAEPEPVSESEPKSESEPTAEPEAKAEAEPKGESEGKSESEKENKSGYETKAEAEPQPEAESEGKAG